MSPPRNVLVACGLIAALAGCSSGTDTTPTPNAIPEPAAAAAPAADSQAMADAPIAGSSEAAALPAPIAIPSISLGGAGATAAGGSAAQSPAKVADRRTALLDAMLPLQIMLGKWRGTTQRDFGEFKAVDEPEWVWDFQTDRDQPAMVMTSSDGVHLREARLTYLVDRNLFQLTTRDAENRTRTLEGSFSQPVEEYQGDDKKLHRRYKLELTEVDPADPKDQWQIVFNQQDNNRYLLQLAEKRGSRFGQFDTVGTQRAGTSVALNDEDYGEKKCVISGGLGTIQVSYQGKSYWVCCTGCQAAFNEDPASWIAEYEAKATEK